MAFDPKNDDHAIVEAVFGLRLSRPIQKAEIDRVAAAHDEWRDWMPKISRQEGITFSVGAGPDQQIAFQGSGVLFDRMLPDGSLEWRLRIDGANVFVNCLSYTRWSEIWSRVRSLLERILELLASDDLSLNQIILQYIDTFEWKADLDTYDVSLLLRGGNMVPHHTLKLGPWWHLYQGWFRDEKLLPLGRLLERLNIDATVDDKGRPTVKFDSYLAFDLPEAEAVSARPLAERGKLDTWFDVLHNLDKALLRSCLTDEVAERIKLNG